MPDRATSPRYEIPAGPEQFEISMKPEFAQKYNRDEIVGTPIRKCVDDQVAFTGIVVDWVDGPDGSVTLIVEQRAF
jgi:hypothetical protein